MKGHIHKYLYSYQRDIFCAIFFHKCYHWWARTHNMQGEMIQKYEVTICLNIEWNLPKTSFPNLGENSEFRSIRMSIELDENTISNV